MAFRKKNSRKHTTAPKRFVRRAVSKAYKQRTNRIIRSVVNRVAEHKVQTYYQTFSPITMQSGAPITTNVFPMTPLTGYWLISQGSQQGERIGNKIGTKSVYLDINFTQHFYNATTYTVPRPFYVRIWFVKYKPSPNALPPSSSLVTSGTANFFQNGSTNFGFVGTFADLQYHVNSDVYTLYGYRTFKVGYSNSTGTGSSAGDQYYANNDFKLAIIKRINLTKMFPKHITFSDNTATPTSGLISMVCQVVPFNGLTPNPNQQPISGGFTLTYNYTDI